MSVTTCGTPPAGDPAFPKRSNPINGFDSVNQASYRAFGNLPGINAGTSCNGDFGDAKGLDLWTYFPGLSPKGTLNIVGFPDLTIAKTHTGNFTAGGQGTYTISVSNAANAGPTTGTITVTDTLPNGLTFVSGSGSGWTCSASGQTVTCTNAGPLAAGASSTITLTVNATAAGNVINSASVSTPEETNTGNNSATDSTTIVNPAPDLTIAKTHTGNFTAGGQGTYTISVSNAANAGPTTGTITVTDTLPNGLTFVSGSGNGWTCSASGQDVTCTNAGPLAAGASSTITLTVNATAAGNVTNSASVSTPEETNTGNNSATDSTTRNRTQHPAGGRRQNRAGNRE